MAHRPRLLIVDDDRSTATLLGLMLDEDGFETEVELDGAAALVRLLQEPGFDAVITDFHVPGADGIAIATCARGTRTEMPVFVLTGDPSAVEVANASRPDPVEVVAKPIDYRQLVRQLQEAVGLEKPPRDT